MATRYYQLRDEKWLRDRYEKDARTTTEIAEEIGCNLRLVTDALRDHGIKARTPAETRAIRGTNRKHTIAELNDKEWMIKHYVTLGHSLATIADQLHCSETIVSRSLKKHGISARANSGPRASETPVGYEKLGDRDYLSKRYTGDGFSMDQIAREIGCTGGAVLKAMRRFGIQSRAAKGKGRRTPRSLALELRDPEWLSLRFLRDHKSIGSIARELGCARGPVISALRNFGISRKHGHNPTFRQASEVFPVLSDTDFLKKQYLNEGKTVGEISKDIGCSEWALRAALCRFHILKYDSRSYDKKDVDLPTGKRRDEKGYVRVYLPDHPFANKRGWVFEHRLVCESILGRYLTPEEEVHHLNIKTDDNRESNLLVMASYRDHMEFHRNPPAWVPRCPCCGKPEPEKLAGRPADVPLEWKP